MIPVIAIDGPSASGKGSVAERVAEHLGFHYLDSGAIYRLLAFSAHQAEIAWNDEIALANHAQDLNIQFKRGEVYLNGKVVSAEIRTEAMGKGASEVAVHPAVRAALLQTQKNFRQSPGLVADGRDMASVVFTDAVLKVFLTADVEIRAQRRYQQLLGRVDTANYDLILDDLKTRDLRDSQRASAPLKQLDDAILVDTSDKSIAEAVEMILSVFQNTAQKTAQN